MASAVDASFIDLATLPTPEHITLLLKRHRSTVLLSILPETSVAEIKASLLAALLARGVSTLPGTDTPLPEDANDLEFGVPKDKKDLSKGWVAIEVKEQELADSKAGKRKAGAKKLGSNESPAFAGLVDGSMIAYRIKTTTGKHEDEDAMSDILEDPGWDVVLPTFEEEGEAEDEEADEGAA